MYLYHTGMLYTGTLVVQRFFDPDILILNDFWILYAFVWDSWVQRWVYKDCGVDCGIDCEIHVLVAWRVGCEIGFSEITCGICRIYGINSFEMTCGAYGTCEIDCIEVTCCIWAIVILLSANITLDELNVWLLIGSHKRHIFLVLCIWPIRGYQLVLESSFFRSSGDIYAYVGHPKGLMCSRVAFCPNHALYKVVFNIDVEDLFRMYTTVRIASSHNSTLT